MNLPGPSHTNAERLGLIVGCAIVAMMAFETIAPFFLAVPQSSIRLIDQQQTILQSVFMVLVGYLWGQNSGNKVKDSTIETLAKTAQTAGAALPGVGTAGPELIVPVGSTAKVTATEDGTEIKPDP